MWTFRVHKYGYLTTRLIRLNNLIRITNYAKPRLSRLCSAQLLCVCAYPYDNISFFAIMFWWFLGDYQLAFSLLFRNWKTMIMIVILRVKMKVKLLVPFMSLQIVQNCTAMNRQAWYQLTQPRLLQNMLHWKEDIHQNPQNIPLNCVIAVPTQN